MHQLTKPGSPRGLPRRALARILAAVSLVSAVGFAVPAAPAAAAAAPPLPGDVTQFTTPVIDPSGLFMLTRGADNSILVNSGIPSNNDYTPFFSIGGQILGDPTGVLATPGSIGARIFARDTSNQAITNVVVGSTPTGFQVIPGLLISSRIAPVNHPFRGFEPPMTRIFARGLDDGALYTNLLVNGVPQGWVNLGGFLTSEIAAAQVPFSIPDVFVRVVARGADNHVYSLVLNSSSGQVITSWTPLGTLLATNNPTLANGGSTLIPRGNEVFVRGQDTAVWTWNFNSPGWVSLGGRITGDIAVSIPSDNGLHLHVRGINNPIFLNRRPPGGRFGGYINLGGVLTGNIAASGGGRFGRTVVDQFITRTRENGISSRIQLNLVGGFTSFFNIGGPPVA